MFSNNFNVDWWLAQHLILFSKNVFAETTSFIPLPKLGLEDLRENADLTSLVFGRSIGQMGTLMKDMFYMSIGSEKAKYTRNVGPFSWQEKGSYKIMNHTLSLFGVKGKFYDPVGRGIQTLVSERQYSDSGSRVFYCAPGADRRDFEYGAHESKDERQGSGSV